MIIVKSEEIAKQSVEDAAWFLPDVCSKIKCLQKFKKRKKKKKLRKELLSKREPDFDDLENF